MRLLLILLCLVALVRAGDGLLTVSRTGVAFGATVRGGAEGGTTVAGTGAPSAELAFDYDSETGVSATGTLPPGLSPETLAMHVPGLELDGVQQAEAGAGGDAEAGWERALEGVSIVLPRFQQAHARLGGGRLAITGKLKRGFSAEGTRATLLAALGRGWRLALDLTETEPLADVVFSKTDDTLILSGLLPAGLSPGEATELLGAGAVGDGLAGGGAGDADDWSQVVTALGHAAGRFYSLRGQVAGSQVSIAGVLRPGYAADAVTGALSAAVPKGWTVAVSASETPASEGDRRTGPETGAPEVFRRGFWLPELNFPVSQKRCAAEADAALQRERVRFVAGSAAIDEAGMALIDRLAAIAVRCLNSSDMRLEIAAHTDSVGNDAENQALSEARAASVRDALLARGVRADALTARGYGESQPIASNDTAEGRARNRRIAFNWSGH